MNNPSSLGFSTRMCDQPNCVAGLILGDDKVFTVCAICATCEQDEVSDICQDAGLAIIDGAYVEAVWSHSEETEEKISEGGIWEYGFHKPWGRWGIAQQIRHLGKVIGSHPGTIRCGYETLAEAINKSTSNQLFIFDRGGFTYREDYLDRWGVRLQSPMAI